MTLSPARRNSIDGEFTNQSYVGKRMLDYVIATPLAVVSVPLVFVAGVLIRADSRGGAIFTQDRAGFAAKPFSIYKLRTMYVGNTHTGEVRGRIASVSRVGHVLRRTKIDELPQLWNVIKGDMSLVGPRPCLIETAPTAESPAHARFTVRPGLTGLAQIQGNIDLTWEERYQFDIEYVRTNSFGGDLRILGRTVIVIFRGDRSKTNVTK